MDNEKYKSKEKEIKQLLKEQLQGESSIIFTSYEDELIRKVRNYKYIGSLLQHILYWRKSFKYACDISKFNYENVYCLNPIVGIFLGVKRQNSRIVLAGFLFEPKKNRLYYWLRKQITKKALEGIDKVLVYSSKEVNYYKKIFPKVDFAFVKYGIDYFEEKKYLGKLPDKYFFSGGGSNRNYKFLVEAYNHYSTKKQMLPLVIVTQGWRLNGLDTSKCVVLEDVVLENFWEVLSKSELLILSLKDSEISAGHMVMFQAMKQKIPVIVNDIPAVRDYVDDKAVIFYDSEDENALGNILYDRSEDKYKKITDYAYDIYSRELTFLSFIQRVLKQ